MIKQLTMNQETLIWALLKPKLKRTFNFAELSKVHFTANNVTDKLELMVEGYLKGETTITKSRGNDLKLSDNKMYVDIYLKKIDEELTNAKSNIIIKSIGAIYMTIDFNNPIDKSKPLVNSVVYYTNDKDIKGALSIDLNNKK
jgi:hypothetical protein